MNATDPGSVHQKAPAPSCAMMPLLLKLPGGKYGIRNDNRFPYSLLNLEP